MEIDQEEAEIKHRAAREYFIDFYREKRERSPSARHVFSTYETVSELTSEAVEAASEVMDGEPLEYEISDHYLHWIVDLKIPSLQETPYYIQEVALDRVPVDEINLDTVNQFFRDVLKVAVEEVGFKPITATYLREICDKIDEMRESCAACRYCYTLRGVEYIPGGFTLEFVAHMWPENLWNLDISFKVSRSLSKIAMLNGFKN